MVSCEECVHYRSPNESLENPYLGEEVPYCEKLRIKNLRLNRAMDCLFFTTEEVDEIEKKRKEIMKLSKGDIAEKYGLSKSYASVVLSALKPERFEILKKDLSLSQMRNQLGISKSTVRAYLSALKQVGIIKD